MSKILILANFDGGLYKFRKELIAHLIAQGHDVTISLPNGDLVAPLVQMGCTFIDTPVDRRGINPKTDRILMKKYQDIVNDVAPDLTITYTIKPNIYGGMACQKAHVPYAINITGLGTAFQKKGLLKTLVIWLYRKACKQVDMVFFENSKNRDTLLEYGIVKKDRTYVLAGAGVNLEEYPLTDYPKEEEKIHLLFIGRMMKEKGIEELFDAMEELAKVRDDVVLDLVGFYEEDYADRIKALESKGLVIYHGYQEDVRPFIAKSSVFVLPSYHEGMANTLLECASMGRPLLTSNIPGCMEAVEEGAGGNGLLFQVQDAIDLYDKIVTFLNLPYETRRAMGLKSRQLMAQKFDKKKVVEATYKQLEQIISEK